MTNKICSKCNISLPCTEEYFFKRSDQFGKFRSHCRKCHHDANIERLFKLSCEKYNVTTQEERRSSALKSNRDAQQYKRIYPIEMRLQDHRDELTNKYLSQMLIRRNLHISIHTLRKYPNVADSLRMILRMKRAYGYTNVPKINVCLDFEGDRVAKKKYLGRGYSKFHSENLTDYYIAGQICYYYGTSTEEVRQSSELLQTKRLIIQIKREIKHLKQVV